MNPRRPTGQQVRDLLRRIEQVGKSNPQYWSKHYWKLLNLATACGIKV